MGQSRLETVYWICHGLEPFETREALTLERLRKAQLDVPSAGVFDVTWAERINGQLVARCWPAKMPNSHMNDTTVLTPPAGTDAAYLERVEHITGRSWPLLVDGPSEYRTRNGRRAVVSNGQLQAIGEHPLDLVAKLKSASQT